MEKMTNVTPPNPRVIRIINNVRLVVFLLTGAIFIATYLPIQLGTCNQMINQTPNYVYNASCYCKGNVGSSQLVGQTIIQNTTWFKQFGSPQTLFFSQGDITIYLPNLTVSLNSDSLLQYMEYFFAMQFSNMVVHEFTISMFEILSYPNVIIPPTGHPLCTIVVRNSTWFDNFYATTTEECSDFLQSAIPGIETNLTIRYSDNLIYQQYCDLSYCEISYCPFNQQVTIGFFVATVLSTIYMVLRVIKFTILWFLYKKYKMPTTVTVPMLQTV